MLESAASATLSALGTCGARRLALRPDVGLAMAGEPDAPLLGDPMAFYVPRSQDTFDGTAFLAALKAQGAFGVPSVRSRGILQRQYEPIRCILCALRLACTSNFLTDKPTLVPDVYHPPVKVHGFGLEGEAAAEEVLLLVMRERPNSIDQLLAGQRTQVTFG